MRLLFFAALSVLVEALRGGERVYNPAHDVPRAQRAGREHHARGGSPSGARRLFVRDDAEDGRQHNATDVVVSETGESARGDVVLHLLLERDRAARSAMVATSSAPKSARHLTNVNSLIRTVTPEGFVATVDCPEGSLIAEIKFAAYGMVYLDNAKNLQVSRLNALVPSSSCACPANIRVCTRAQQVCSSLSRVELWDAFYPSAFDLVSKACVGRMRCDIEAETGLFSGGVVPPWDKDWANAAAPYLTRPEKRLAIEAQCRPVCARVAPAAANAVVATTLNDPFDRTKGAVGTYTCSAGFYQTGGSNTLTCSFPVSDFGQPTIACSDCGLGNYCPGDGKRYSCMTGTYATNARHTNWFCGGFCEPGYICPAGSTSAFSTPCGGTGDYICPRSGTNYAGGYHSWWWWWGWSWGHSSWWWSHSLYRPLSTTIRVLVPAGFYSAPLDLPADRRYFYLPCEPNRECKDGLMLPHFTWRKWSTCNSRDLVSGQSFTSVPENVTGAASRLTVSIDTPGFTGTDTVDWQVLDIVGDPASRWFGREFQWTYRGTRRWQRCPVSSLEMVATAESGRVANLRLKPGAPPLLWETCGRRVPVVIRASRPDAPSVRVECLVHVDVRRDLRPPSVINCNGVENVRAVQEGESPGTSIGTPLVASQVGGMQPGVVIRWGLADWRDRTDFAVDTCTGQLFTSDILNKTTMPLIADVRRVVINVWADGAALGMGSTFVQCTALVNVTRRNNVPTVSTAELSFNELQPADTLVGHVLVSDPDFDDVGRVRLAWSSSSGGVDARDPTAFVINATTGAVSSTYVLDALSSGIYKYYLTVNATDGKAWVTSPLTIVVNALPRPPVVPDHVLSILEFTEDGSTTRSITPLRYTHPLNDNVTWTLSPNTTFGVDESGRVFLLPDADKSLDFQVEPSISLTAFARDGAGNLANGQVTLHIVECNRPPVFDASLSLNASLAEYSEEGIALGLRVTALDRNLVDTVSYRIVSTLPHEAADLFVLDSRSGLLRLNAGLPGGVFTLNETWTWPGGSWSVILTISATDNGIPSKSAETTVLVNITEVRPRVRDTVYTAPLNVREGTSLGVLPLWMPPASAVSGMSAIVWSIEGTDDAAVSALAVNNATGEVVLVNASPLSYNVRRVYSATAVATYTIPRASGGARPVSINSTDDAVLADMEVSLSRTTVRATAEVTLSLTHVNRAPRWNTSLPVVYAPFRYAGVIGPALLVHVSDEDSALVDVRERQTFTIIGGNTADSALAINATNGQLSVVQPGSSALVYVQGQAAPTVTLTVQTCDAGIGGASICAAQAVVVEVLEGNLPPVINTTRLSVAENTPVGRPVGTPVRASDPDPGTTLTYAIVWATVEDAFTINNRTGQLFVSTADLDFERRHTYTLVVLVTDSGRVPLSATGEVYISLTDVNEAPVISAAGPFSLPENSAVRTVVGVVQATDIDAEDASSLRYSIVSSSTELSAKSSTDAVGWSLYSGFFLFTSVSYEQTQAPFSIDAVTGEIWVSAGGLNMESVPTYSLMVRASDARGLVDDKQVTISLTNVNDRPEMDDMLVFISENVYGSVGRLNVHEEDFDQKRIFSPGPHADTHFCTAWHSRRSFLEVWEYPGFQQSLTQSTPTFWFPSTAPAPVDLFLLAASAPLVIDLRVGGPGRARVALSGSPYGAALKSDQEWEDRYEVIVDSTAGTVAVWRYVATAVSGSGYTFFRGEPSLLALESVPDVLAAPDGSMHNYFLRLSGADKATVEFGVRSSNNLDAVYTTRVSVLDTRGTLPHIRSARRSRKLYVTMDASTPHIRISSVCWTASAFVGGYVSVDYADGVVYTGLLDYEGRRYIGQEVEVTDMPTGTALAPAYLNDYSVVELEALDTNEAPSWNASALTMCENSTIARVLVCVDIPENTPAGTIIATVPRAVDPDVFFSWNDDSVAKMEQGLDYTFRLDNVARSAVAIDFAPTTSFRWEGSYADDEYYGVFEFGLNHSNRDVVVVSPELLDFEVDQGTAREYRVWATDFGWTNRLSSPFALVVIRLTDVNEPPSLNPVPNAWRVEELANPGSLIGTPSDLRVTDPDTPGTSFATLAFSITGGTGAGLFAIHSVTGQISTAPGSVMDFEATALYTLTVTVVDGGGLSASASINVTLLDMNEQPVLTLPAAVNVSETQRDTFGPVMELSDPDRASFHTWSIAGGSGAAHFTVTCGGRLAVLPDVTLDFEVDVVTFTLVIRVEDNGNPGLYDEKSVVVHIVDANEAPAVLPSQRFVVDEAAPAGFPLGVINFTDPDMSSATAAWRTPTFSLANEGSALNVLTVHPSTGLLSVGSRSLLGIVDSTVDTDVTLIVNVDVTDGGGLRGRDTVEVKVLGVNYPPTWSVFSPLTLSVDENTPSSPALPGDFVGSPVPATDRNGNHVKRLEFAVAHVWPTSGAGYFAVDASALAPGLAQLVLTAAAVLDHEAVPSYVVELLVVDPQGASAALNVTVLVRDRNEAPTFAYPDAALLNFSVRENSLGGAAVGEGARPRVSDPEGDALTFSITGGTGAGLFTIHNATGSVFVAANAVLDFERTPTYTLFVTGTDTGFPDGSAADLSFTTLVLVQLMDVNEAPVWQTVGMPATFYIPENAATGTEFGSVAPFVADVDTDDVLAYSIDSSAWARANNVTANPYAFVIDAVTGQLSVAPRAAQLDFEGNSPLFVVSVVAVDRNGLRATATVTVVVTNVNEAPRWAADGASSAPVWTKVFVRLEAGNVIGRPLAEFASDPDSAVQSTGEKLAFSIERVSASKLVTGVAPEPLNIASLESFVSVDPSTGQLSLGNVEGYPAIAAGMIIAVDVSVTVSDAGNAAATRTFTFTTTDNNKPPVCTAQTFVVPENTAAGAVVGEVLATDPDQVTGQALSFTLTQSVGAMGQPLAFTLTSVNNRGVLRVSPAGAALLDYESLAASAVAAGTSETPTLVVQVTVTDGNVNFPLTAQCTISITVTDVNEAPRLRPATVAAPATFNFVLPENSRPGTVLQLLQAGTVALPRVTAAAAVELTSGSSQGRSVYSSGGRSLHLAAIDVDAADTSSGSLTFALRTSLPGAPDGLFSIDAQTGVLSVSASATALLLARLDFEGVGGRVFTLNATVTDRAGLTDSAVVRVTLTDMNDPLVWRAFFNLAGAEVTSFSVLESLPGGSRFGNVSAADVDAGSAGSLRFALVMNAESAPFLIDPLSGALSTCPTCSLDWEDKTVWQPVVTVSDTSPAPLTINTTLTVSVQDVFDVTILAANLGPGASGVVVEGSAFAASHSDTAVLVPTRGGQRIVFSGANVGVSPARLAREGLTLTNATTISATYGPTTGREYTAVGCKMYLAGMALECTTTASAGSSFLWRFAFNSSAARGVAGSVSSGSIRTGTLPPVISSVAVSTDATGAVDHAVQVLNTTGGSFLVLRGDNFGPLGVSVSVRYTPSEGRRLTATACVVTTAHTRIVCTSVPGVGKALTFTLSVTNAASQTSDELATTLAYARPVVTSVAVSAPLCTPGGEGVTLLGSSFGPQGSGPIDVAYTFPAVWALNSTAFASPGVSDLVFAASSCAVVNDTAVVCTSGAGYGTRLVPRLILAGQESDVLTSRTAGATLSYTPPVITSLAGNGVDRMPTSGGAAFRLSGAGFGPVLAGTAEKQAGIAAVLGPSFLPIPVVMYGSLYVEPTAPVKPSDVPIIEGGGCSGAVTRCTSQCGTSSAECVSEAWRLTPAPPGTVCFERADNVTGSLVAAFINATDARCTPVSRMQYTALACALVVPHASMECATAPGVGKWHHVKIVSVGGQGSGAFAGVSYAPPVITEFSGQGSFGASTAGEETVVISGLNFGADGGQVKAVSYGYDSREFEGVDCALTLPHTEITCKTSPGAGARLAWTVRVANQDSVTPLTDYAPPSVVSISGPGAVDAPTQGGSVVFLTGSNFATQAYLESVTYGPTGTEYAAAGCVVTEANVEITCVTVPGTGRKLLWRVTVRGQTSRPSPVHTSYAAPDARSLSSAEGDTSGTLGIAMYGFHLGVAVATAPISVHMDRYGTAGFALRDIGEKWDAWRAALLQGDVAKADELRAGQIATWLSEATSLPLLALLQLPDSEEGLVFDIPDGCGRDREVVVFTDGVPSDVLNFNYRDAVITNVAPVRDARGNLRVVVEGTNFCGTPSTMVADVSGGREGGVVVLEERPDETVDLVTVVVPGALDSPATDMSSDVLFQMTGVPSFRRARALQTAAAVAASSSPSTVDSATGSGTSILVNGRSVPPTVVSTRRVETLIPEPAELSTTVTTIAIAGAAGSTPAVSFSDPSPYFNSGEAYKAGGSRGRELQAGMPAPGLSGMNTAGGERVFFPNVTSLNTGNASDVTVLIGGRPCTSVALTNGPGAGNKGSWTWTVSCTTPPGIGRNLTISICSAASQSGCSPSFDNRAFTYAPPVVTDINTAAGSVLLSASATGGGIPTAGGSVRITGKGFGSVAALGAECTVKVTVSLFAEGLALTLDAPVLNQTDTEVTVSFPQGYGPVAGVLVQTQNVGASIAGEAYVQSAEEGRVKYASPTLTSLSSTSRSTAGGAVLTLRGDHFGPLSMAPTVTVGGRPCALLNHTHTSVACTLPAGQGASVGVSVTLAGQTSPASPASSFAYSPPRVTAVTPTTTRTDGRDALGAPVTMYVLGDNFGVTPVVELTPSLSFLARPDPIVVPTSAMTRAQHDRLEFTVPEGAGRDLRVVVRAGDQVSFQPLTFSYAAPSIAVVTRLGRAAGACVPATEVVPRVRDGMYVNRTSRPDCFPTAGGFTLSIQGASFGHAGAAVAVTVGSRTCKLVGRSHGEVVCALSAGMGQGLPVVVSVAGQANGGSPAASFSFDAPVVTSVLPNIPFAGERLLISGYNFGDVATPVRIMVGGSPCVDARYVNDSQLTCVSPPGPVGPKSLSILAANRSTPFTYATEEEVLIYQCKVGSYGLVGEECVDCTREEPGADCPGGEMYTDLVTALPGWFRVDINITARAQDRQELCHPKRQQREACPAFLPCSPAGACPGANVCKVGYAGLRCATCQDGFYKLNDGCVECPDRSSALVIIFAVIAIAAPAAVYVMSSKGAVWPMALIVIDYAQVLGLMNRFGVKWPAPIVTRWLVAASASFLNLELIAPECAVSGISFGGKWAAIEMLPLLMSAGLLAAFAVTTLLRLACGRARKGGEHHPFVASGLVMYRLLYVYIARNTLDVFNCAPLSSGDTRTEYLASNLDIPCYVAGGEHIRLVAAGVVGVVLYLLVIPAGMATVLYRNRTRVFMDQLTRARGEVVPTTHHELEAVHTAPSHPDAAFRRVWQSFYAPFKPGSWYWEGIIAARKFAIIFTSLMYNRTTTFQQALCLLALFVAAALHLRVRPRFTADTASRLLSKYDSRVQYQAAEEAKAASFAYRKARKHSSRHLDIVSGGGASTDSVAPGTIMQAKELASAISRIRQKKQIYSLAAVKTRSVLLQRRILLTYPVLSVFLDGNAVEAMLLFSLILQGLAGVMFGSQLFSGANLERFFAMQYDAMAGATTTLLAVTAVYIAVCLALDVLHDRDPDALESLATSLLSWNATNAEITSDKHTLLGATLGSSRALRHDARPKSMAVNFVPNAGAARREALSTTSAGEVSLGGDGRAFVSTPNPLRALTGPGSPRHDEPVHSWSAADEEELEDEEEEDRFTSGPTSTRAH